MLLCALLSFCLDFHTNRAPLQNRGVLLAISFASRLCFNRLHSRHFLKNSLIEILGETPCTLRIRTYPLLGLRRRPPPPPPHYHSVTPPKTLYWKRFLSIWKGYNMGNTENILMFYKKYCKTVQKRCFRGRDHKSDWIFCQNCFLLSVQDLRESCVPSFTANRFVVPEILLSVS